MPINEPLTITLTHELSDRVRAEIATGGYKNPIDVIAGGLDALHPDDDGFEPWMRQDIMEACDELDRDPSQVITLDQLGEELKVEYANARKAG
jgi:Arc/MetJ-type ribon-helix-helix transcriptional regulator